MIFFLMFGMRQRQPEDIKRTNNRHNHDNFNPNSGNNDDSSDIYWTIKDSYDFVWMG